MATRLSLFRAPELIGRTLRLYRRHGWLLLGLAVSAGGLLALALDGPNRLTRALDELLRIVGASLGATLAAVLFAELRGAVEGFSPADALPGGELGG